MMVCTYDESRFLLVLQTDHSRVAGHLAAHWGNGDFAALRPYTSMVLAAQEHDSGWWDWEIKPTVNDQGYPIDYIGSMKSIGYSWLDFQRNGIERVAERDPYSGFIVSMHISGLLSQGMGLLPYMPEYAGDTRVQEYLGRQEKFRHGLLDNVRASGWNSDEVTEEYLWTNFKHMEVFDQMAQFICNRYPFNSAERKNGPTNMLSDTPVPVAPGLADVTLSVRVQDEARAIVQPYPFDVDPLVISFPARLLPRVAYASQEEFLRHFYKPEGIMVTYSLHSG